MNEKPYSERERDYLIKVVEQANVDWYNVKKTHNERGVVPRYGDYMADRILTAGFAYQGDTSNDQLYIRFIHRRSVRLSACRCTDHRNKKGEEKTK